MNLCMSVICAGRSSISVHHNRCKPASIHHTHTPTHSHTADTRTHAHARTLSVPCRRAPCRPRAARPHARFLPAVCADYPNDAGFAGDLLPAPAPAPTPVGGCGAGWGCAKSAGAPTSTGNGTSSACARAVSEIGAHAVACRPHPPWVKLTPSPFLRRPPSVHLVWHPCPSPRDPHHLSWPLAATPASPCCSSSRCRPCPRLTRARPCRRPWCRSSAHSRLPSPSRHPLS